ncbi:unnamed protein product [marine sediment metagenome]|uniref:Uncharacterized protein n=1 Tax=marine sediment metagenome TaxID=412755 RepID=X1IKR6_9ZZZZ
MQNISKNKLLLEINEMNRIEVQQKIIQTEYDQIISDLFFLADFSTLQNIFENINQKSNPTVGKRFFNLFGKKEKI